MVISLPRSLCSHLLPCLPLLACGLRRRVISSTLLFLLVALVDGKGKKKKKVEQISVNLDIFKIFIRFTVAMKMNTISYYCPCNIYFS